MEKKNKNSSKPSCCSHPILAPGWEIFTITYQLPIFGSDPAKPNYGNETLMMVGTQGGYSDAKKACEHYHKGCKILSIQSSMEVAAGIKRPLNKKGASK